MEHRAKPVLQNEKCFQSTENEIVSKTVCLEMKKKQKNKTNFCFVGMKKVN